MARNAESPSGERQTGLRADDVAFAAPDQRYRRPDCLRIRLPGIDDHTAAVAEPIVGPLVEAIDAVFDANAGIDMLELLSFPGPDQQEYLLHGTPRGVTEPGQTTLQQASGGRSIPGTIAARLDDHLPDGYGLERVDLDLGVIGIAPRPTCRLVLPQDRTVTPRQHLDFAPAIRLLRALHSDRLPYLWQVLVRRHGQGEFTASVRLATFLVNTAIETVDDLKGHVNLDHPHDLRQVFSAAGFSSNFNLPIKRYYRIYDYGWGPRVSLRRNVGRRPAAKRTASVIKALYKGHMEFRDLLRGRDCYPDAYADALGYPKFTVTPAQLETLVGLFPGYYERDAWAVTESNPPAVTTQELVAEATGTSHTFGEDETAAPTLDVAQVANEGGATHQSLVEFTAQWYREQEYDVEVLDQDTTSQPDLRLHRDGTTTAVEVESTNRSKAANLLANVARALAHDREVVVVTTSERAARWAVGRLREPFKTTTADATQLYNWTAPVRLRYPDTAADTAATGPASAEDAATPDAEPTAGEDARDTPRHTDPRPDADATTDRAAGAIPVLPEGVEEATWWLAPDGTLTLTPPDRSRALASGPATAGVGTFTYDTPRYRVADDTHVILDADGDYVTDYATKQALTSDWTLVRRPHVPLRLSYLEATRVRYQDGRALARLDPRPDWDVPKNSQRYTRAVQKFLTTYTVTREGAELPKDVFRERCLQWYRRLTDREAPGPMWFGRAIPDDVAMKARQEDGRKREFLADRTWRYPDGLLTPGLPGVSVDGDGSPAAASDDPDAGDD